MIDGTIAESITRFPDSSIIRFLLYACDSDHRGRRTRAAFRGRTAQAVARRRRPADSRAHVAAFLAHPAIDDVIVALPQELVDDPRLSARVEAVARRRRRDAAPGSVANAFFAATSGSDLIVIHDAARPFASAGLIARTIAAAAESGAAWPRSHRAMTVRPRRRASGVEGRAQDEREPARPPSLTLSESPFDRSARPDSRGR